MKPTSPFVGVDRDMYYLAHHPVVKKKSITTKVRPVFDSSMKTLSGISLNNQLHTGPKLQDDLTSIMLKWRKYEYAFSSDIEKMFRMINMQPCHWDFQRVLH